MRKFLMLAFVFIPAQALAYGGDCESSVTSYNAAVDDVSHALEAYADCLSFSAGKDDCGLEFGKIEHAHNEIESAVYDIDMNCE